ncbi:hypothetical protein WA026_003400 [Henosepilachna vigintioctopunctata]|uniref:N-acetyltransferase domain-containing protein n=1 Tax=Henosepilachna vigintioctopunctata TaxID=420089 RepID=A0AAW1THG3_9CUCU
METKISPISKPAIWKTFERTTKEGKVKKFWTQNLLDDHKELAMNYLLDHFMREEPLCSALKMRETVDSSNELCEIWQNMLPQNCTLACYTVDDDMQEKLVGLNICYRNSQSDDKIDYHDKTERTRKLMAFLDDILYTTELYQRFGVDEYLGALGLFTVPEYRGYNIGFELLDSRRYLCQTLGIRLSVTIFTGPASQRLAEKAGFRDVYPVSLDDIEARNPFLIIPGLRNFTNKIRLMYILYD